MKSKIINAQNQEPEQEDGVDKKVEIDAGGPAIASAKKSKVAIIAASSVLITLVIYFMFFKGGDSNKKPEKLEEVAAPVEVSGVAPADGGKSFFEIDASTKSKEDLDLLKKPQAPEAPKLPELPKDTMTPPQSPIADALLAPILPKPTVNPSEQAPAVTQQVNNHQDNKEAHREAPKKELNPRYSPIIVVQNPTDAVSPNGAPAASTANSVGYNENIVKLNVDGFDSLQKTQVTTKTTYIEDRVHTIAQGKLINAVLETAINTELPGLVRGIVSRDVYGEAGTEILIPKGSRLFGSYSSKITRGQGRVEIGWSRLIRPDGVDMTISFSASDQFGRAGVNGEIDNKYGAVVANSMLTSILAVGSVAAVQKLLTNNGTTVTTNNPQQGTVTTAGSATNQAIYDVSKTIVDTVGQVISNSLDLQPIIRVPQGTRITVIVNADINVPSMKRR